MTWERRAMTDEPLYSAVELATMLKLENLPTPEQARVIESAREPALVVAGAGSGKTETMAARVVWLVANQYVAPHDVLGLTFTRKAAGQLAARIRSRIATLAQHGLITGDPDDDINVATVSTYNAFANRLYGQYAIHLGLDPEATVIGDAVAWQLARDVVRTSTDPELLILDKRLNDITSGVLDISRSLNDNVASADEVIAYGEKMRAAMAALEGTKGTAEAKKTFESTKNYADALPVLVRLALDYDDVKRRKGFIEFSDQVRYALQLCETSPTVVADVRDQFKVVLLDEYQDTSVVQTRLLTTIFRDTPVMAVGDPHQSIYGWRGASATNMAQFATDFGVRDGQPPFSLSTSWRNPVDVLAAANRYVQPLSAASAIPVETLKPRPAAPPGHIELSFTEEITDETDAVARWFADNFVTGGNDKTAAVLFRATRTMSAFRAAFEKHGVPCHVVGLGGLLDEPVIVDLVCALRVMHDATADSELVRLLAGPRWMIAPRDLVGLRAVARWLGQHNHHRQLLDDDVRQALRSSVTAEDSESLVDALDFLASTSTDYDVFGAISDEGRARLRDAGAFIARLRRHATFDLRDLVTFVYQELLLDIEVAANPDAPGARGAFDAFLEPLSAFVASTERATLGSFLGWLREAERREKMSPATPKIEKGTVQLMTIHAAKGLEWDFVAVPRLVTNELPGNRTLADTWRMFGALPYEFRGDARDLPVWAWRGAKTIEDLHNSYALFREDVRIRYDAEERRLAYVAVTRTESRLLLSGSYWNTQVAIRKPSVFLDELIESGILATEIPPPLNPDVNPRAGKAPTASWPRQPLGLREQAVRAAADQVTAQVANAGPALVTPWDDEITLLLAERDVANADVWLPAPRRIAASKFKDFVSTPTEVAASVRRPMPQQPYRATLLGTIFHEWVERRASRANSLPGDLLEALENLDDDELVREGPVDVDALRALQDTFLASEWAELEPIDVEREIHIVIAGVTVVCKIDAVYRRTAADGSSRIDIVDWKTGQPPRDEADYQLKQTQLALYRVAYSRWAGIPIDQIDAAFYFVRDDVVLRPDRLQTEDELVAQWHAAIR